MPVDLYPIGKSQTPSISKDGILSLPEPLMERLGWHPGDSIGVAYIVEPLTILLWAIRGSRAGFKLSYLNRNSSGTTGGKLSFTAFVNQHIRPRFTLPLLNMQPAFPAISPYEMALLLDEPDWRCVEFSANGLDAIPAGTIGVYEILGTTQSLLYVGEGDICSRLRHHLRKDDLVRIGRMIRYLPVDKDDAVILEKVLMSRHEEDYGDLPEFNHRR